MNLVCLFWQWHWLTGRDIHSPLAWGKGWPGWGGPCWPQGIPACRVGGRRKEQAELINQKLQYWWKYLVHLHTYTHRNTLYYSQFHLRLVFLLIDYESRTTCVVFSVLCMLCWYVWRTCAQHRHKLIIKLGKESYLARQKHFFLLSAAFQIQKIIWKYLVCLISALEAFAKARAAVSVCFNPVPDRAFPLFIYSQHLNC